MSVKTFKGGAHPPERKNRSVESPIERVAEPKQVIIPVNQHFGAPLQPIVKEGDTVKKGQKIADAAGRMALPVHASIAGIVKKIEPIAQTNNTEGLAILIEADGSGGEDYMPPLDGFSCSKDEALKRVREAGIAGMGGAGFPMHVKLDPPVDKKIDVAIANGAECEPYLTIDERVMLERPKDVVEGLAIVMRILSCPRGVIAVEDNKARVVPVLEAAIKDAARGMDISVRLLKTKYPQGGEKMLIDAVVGKEVPSGGLPMDVACVVQNIGSLVAVAEAFRLGKPLIERGFTVSGAACTEPKNLFAPIGTMVSDLVDSGIVKVDAGSLRRIVFGGPMMGVAVPHYRIPIQKNSSGLLFMDGQEAAVFQEGPCIRCGRCMRACSCRLSPQLIKEALAADDLAEAEAIGVLDCVECGTCSFVCPAHIQLVQRFRVGKLMIRAKKQKEAPHAR